MIYLTNDFVSVLSCAYSYAQSLNKVGERDRERERQTDRQRETETERHRDRDRETQRDRERQRETETESSNSNSKRLFYTDCSLGSVKTLTTCPC